MDAAGAHTCAPQALPPSGLAAGMANRRHYPDHFVIGRGDQPVDQATRGAGTLREWPAGPKPSNAGADLDIRSVS